MPVHNRCNEIKNKTQHLSAVTHAAQATTQETHCYCTRHVPRRMPRPCPFTTGVMKSRTKHNIYLQLRMQYRRRHRRHTAVAQGTYQGACLVHARSQLTLYNQQPSTTLHVEHSSAVTHATKTTAHTPRPWLRTTVICNGHAATDPQYTYPYPYYAHTIYLPQTYAWSVSTRLVLTWLPVPSPSTTEDQNVSALQLFSECHLRLHYIFTANLCMVGLNKACIKAPAHSEPVDDRLS